MERYHEGSVGCGLRPAGSWLGWAWNRVALGGELFTSLPLYAPDSRPGTGLLKPIQDPIFVPGQAYFRLRHERQVVTLYRQRYDLPYINGNDGRMIPNTFEGYSIDGRWPYGASSPATSGKSSCGPRTTSSRCRFQLAEVTVSSAQFAAILARIARHLQPHDTG